MPTPVTLADLVATTTTEQALAALLGLLQVGDFPVTSWESGSVPSRLTNAEADRYADSMNLVAAIAKGGFVDLSSGDWLTLLAAQAYSLPRKPAVFTQGAAILTDGGGGPYTIAARSLWVESSANRLFTNVGGGTLPLNGTLSLTWEAENPGAAWNVPVNDIKTMKTPLAGVTVNNPGSGGVWITQSGADDEGDDSLRIRCRARWPSLGTGANDLVYTGWALTASPEVTRVKVITGSPSTGDDGTVRLILASPSGGVSGGAVSAVQSYVALRKPNCVKPTALSATVVPITITARLYVSAAYASTAHAAATAAITDYQATLGIGATIYLAKTIDVLMNVPGAVNMDVGLPLGDVVLTATQIPVLTPNLLIVAV